MVNKNKVEVSGAHSEAGAYDYYLFGMLMPDRYVSDTSAQCITVMQPKWLWRWVKVWCKDVYEWQWPVYTPIHGGVASINDNAVSINLQKPEDAVSFEVPVAVGVQQQFALSFDDVQLLGAGASVQVMELQASGWQPIAQGALKRGDVTMSFTPTTASVKLLFTGPMVVIVSKWCLYKWEMVQQQVLVDICSDDKDPYRFGYNGMFKDNEMKGIGNSLDFGARMYDSRIGRWLSIDPAAEVQPDQSRYKAFLNNPNVFIDPDGRKETIFTRTKYEKTGITVITQTTANRIMTDGYQHLVGDHGMFAGNGNFHRENHYYDYSTVIYRTVGVDGKTRETSRVSVIDPKSAVKSRDGVYFGGNKNGDTKIENWGDYFNAPSFIGGVMIYGNAPNNKYSPGDKNKYIPILGSFDFGKYSETMDLIMIGMISEPKFNMKPGNGEATSIGIEKAAEVAKENIKPDFTNNDTTTWWQKYDGTTEEIRIDKDSLKKYFHQAEKNKDGSYNSDNVQEKNK